MLTSPLLAELELGAIDRAALDRAAGIPVGRDGVDPAALDLAHDQRHGERPHPSADEQRMGRSLGGEELG